MDKIELLRTMFGTAHTTSCDAICTTRTRVASERHTNTCSRTQQINIHVKKLRVKQRQEGERYLSLIHI